MSSATNPGCLPKFLRFLAPRREPAQAPTPAAPDELPYALRDDFLSPAEAAFFRVLKTLAAERLLVCPKVALGDIFFVKRPDQNTAFRNKIDRKHVDFLVCHPATLQPLLGIELDDASHQRPDRIARDRFVDEVFATAGLPLAHVAVKPGYSAEEIAALLRSALPTPAGANPADPGVAPARHSEHPTPHAAPPACPKCGVPMVLRTARQGERAGEQFFGCPNYPRCRQVMPVGR